MTSKINPSPLVTSTERSKAMCMLLLVNCLLLLLFFVFYFAFGPCFVVQYLVSFLVRNHLAGEERDGCLKLLLMSRDC